MKHLHLILIQSLVMCTPSISTRTEYSCENSSLYLNCTVGSISILRANYGRLSISMCNHRGFTNISTHCVQSSTKDILDLMCGNLQYCYIDSSNKLFQDPCPGTPKYLEVQYDCVEEVSKRISGSRITPTFRDDKIQQVWEPGLIHLDRNVFQDLLNSVPSEEVEIPVTEESSTWVQDSVPGNLRVKKENTAAPEVGVSDDDVTENTRRTESELTDRPPTSAPKVSKDLAEVGRVERFNIEATLILTCASVILVCVLVVLICFSKKTPRCLAKHFLQAQHRVESTPTTSTEHQLPSSQLPSAAGSPRVHIHSPNLSVISQTTTTCVTPPDLIQQASSCPPAHHIQTSLAMFSGECVIRPVAFPSFVIGPPPFTSGHLQPDSGPSSLNESYQSYAGQLDPGLACDQSGGGGVPGYLRPSACQETSFIVRGARMANSASSPSAGLDNQDTRSFS